MPGPSLDKIVLSVDSFRDWIDKTNDLVNLIKTQTLTASANGDITTGDATLLGKFTSTTLVANTQLRPKSIKTKTADRVVSTATLEVSSSNTNTANFSSPNAPFITFNDNTTNTWKLSLEISPEDSLVLSYDNTEKLKLNDEDGYISFDRGTFSSFVKAPSFRGALLGNAPSATNAVYTDDNQTISGLKTFANLIIAPVFIGDLNGNASQVLNGVYTVGNQTITDSKTFISPINMEPTAQATLPNHIVRSSRLISNGPGITGGGNLSVNRTLSLTGQMLSAHNLNTNGFLFRITDDTIANRTFEAGDGILVSNGNGVSGNPTFTPDIATRQEVGEKSSTVKLITPLRLYEGDSRYTAVKWANQATPISGTAHTWADLVYGRLQLVAVSSSGTTNRVMTSFDGIRWVARIPASDAKNWRGITYSPTLDLYVAVANGGTANQKVMTSPDGITWTLRTTPADNAWNSVTWGAGLLVAVSSTGTANRVMTSPDGITWTLRTSAADEDWQSVTFGGGLFVAVAASGTGNRVMTSPDGINWSIQTSAADLSWRSVTYGNGLFVAVANSGGTNRIMTSPDGITWTLRTAPNSNNWRCVTYGYNLFVAGALSGATNSVMTSLDGITWIAQTTPLNSLFNSIVPISTGFAGVGSNNTCFITE